jgi:glycosyltransferase involved in cell wall biosynthesis
MTVLNVHIYPSPIRNESRILKITKSLVAGGVFEHVLIVGTWEPGLPETERLDSNRAVLRVRTRSLKTKGTAARTLMICEWACRVIGQLKGEAISCINCHSLSTLPLCVMLKKLKGSKLVYDTHELETEVMGSRGMRRLLLKMLERFLIHGVDETVTVNESIASWYRNAYELESVSVVRNMPPEPALAPGRTGLLREPLGLGDKEMVFLYQGVIGVGRGIQILLNVFADLGGGKHIVFMGYGGLVDRVREYSGMYSNIHYMPAVPPDVLHDYTADADVGLCVIENLCLSYYLSLPNKVFEYLNAGLPVVVSRFPEMVRYGEHSGCGWAVSASERNVHALIQTLEPEDITRKRDAVARIRGVHTWESQEEALLSVYRRLGYGVDKV